jgi:hypothetical protein
MNERREMTTAAEVFRPLALALMEWREPPAAPWERVNRPRVYRPFDPQGDTEPFDVQADWEERHDA